MKCQNMFSGKNKKERKKKKKKKKKKKNSISLSSAELAQRLVKAKVNTRQQKQRRRPLLGHIKGNRYAHSNLVSCCSRVRKSNLPGLIWALFYRVLEMFDDLLPTKLFSGAL